MDNQEYLRQISASVSPSGGKKSIAGLNLSGIFSSIYFKIGVGAIVSFIVIVILGSVLGGLTGSGGLENNCISLKLHLDNVSTTINNYQGLVKSSDLRSSSASFTSIISNTNRDLTNFLTATYGFKEGNTKSLDSSIVEEQRLQFDEREQALFKAKINGTLDRYYAHQMAYEISYIMAKENSIIKATRDESLKNSLKSSVSSLENLYPKFNDFSEAKN